MHDPTTCRACEAVPPDASRRYWMGAHPGPWHVIADGPDLMARLPRQAHYVTVLASRPDADGRPALYRGPVYAEWDGQDPAATLAEVRTCLQILATAYDLPLEAVRLWHSGGRGYHLTLPAVVIGAEAGHPRLPAIYGAMAGRLWPASIAPSLDRGIYSAGKGRQWRLPNRRRPNNGRYKVPLSAREVLYRSQDELETLTAHPRDWIGWPRETELSPSPALVDLYRETRAMIEQAPPPAPALDDGACIPQGQRNATLTRMAGAMRRHGMSEAAILAALSVENQRCQPPLAERDVRAIARSIGRYQPAPPLRGDWERRQRAYHERLRLPRQEVQHG